LLMRAHFRELVEADFDPPVWRSALVVWRSADPSLLRVAGFEIVKVVRARSERMSLLDLGELLFGEQPWSQAFVIEAVGGLRSIAAAIAALDRPGPCVVKPRSAVAPSALSMDAPAGRRARVREPAKPRQGRLL